MTMMTVLCIAQVYLNHLIASSHDFLPCCQRKSTVVESSMRKVSHQLFKMYFFICMIKYLESRERANIEHKICLFYMHAQ